MTDDTKEDPSSTYRNICLKDDVQRATAITITATFGIVTIVVFLSLCWYLFCATKSKKQTAREQSKDVKLIRIGSFIALLFYSLGTGIILLGFFLCINQVSAIGGFCSVIGAASILVVFSTRLFYTFTDTVFALSNRFVYYVLFTIALCMALLITGGSLLVTRTVAQTIAGIFAFLIFLLIAVNAIALLIMFIRKLNNVIRSFVTDFGTISETKLSELNKSITIVGLGTLDDKNINSSTSIKQFNPQNNDGTKSTELQAGKITSGSGDHDEHDEHEMNMRALTQLIGDMSKYTILVSIAIISTCAFAVIELIISITNVGTMWTFTCLSFDNCVNSICLLLQFYFFKPTYLHICYKIDHTCQLRITKETSKRLNNESKENGITIVYKLEKTQNGEINVNYSDNGIQSTQPRLVNVNGNKNENNAALSIPSTISNCNNSQQQLQTQASDSAPISTDGNKMIKSVAQKSVDLQMGTN